MPILTINSTTYPYPDVNDTGWGVEAITWADAVSNELTSITNNLATLMTNPFSADGDIVYNASGTPTALALGTPGQFLTPTAGGALEWADPSLIASPLLADGDIFVRIAGVDARLPIGTSGQILNVSAGLLPEWIDSPAGLGDINAGTNLGSAEGVFAQKNVNALEFKGIEGIGTVQASSTADTVTISPRSPSLISSTSTGVSPAREYDILYATDFFSETTPGSTTTSSTSLYAYNSDSSLFEIGFMGNPGVTSFATGWVAFLSTSTTSPAKSVNGTLRVLVNGTIAQIYEFDNAFPGGLAGATTVNYTNVRRVQLPFIGNSFYTTLPAGESEIQIQLELGSPTSNDLMQYRGTWYSKKVR